MEVGAFDAVFQSQSYHLEMSGWDGVLIEPVPEQAEQLRKTRRAKVFAVACVGPEAADRSVTLLSRRGFSTLHFDASRMPPEQMIEVPATTVNQVLAEAGVDKVDFLSVDVEGSEPDTLRGFDFERYKPRLVLVDDRERFGEVCRVMAPPGYRLVRRTGHNAWFVPRGHKFDVGNRGLLHLNWTYGPGRMMRRTRSWISERSARSGKPDS